MICYVYMNVILDTYETRSLHRQKKDFRLWFNRPCLSFKDYHLFRYTTWITVTFHNASYT